MSRKKTNHKDPYQEILAGLEHIIANIESGEIGLDEMEKELSKAKDLISLAEAKIAEVEKIILAWKEN